MRRNQITIKVERFGDQAPNGESIQYGAYADSNDFMEALKEAEKKIIALTTLYDRGKLEALDNGEQRQKGSEEDK